MTKDSFSGGAGADLWQPPQPIGPELRPAGGKPTIKLEISSLAAKTFPLDQILKSLPLPDGQSFPAPQTGYAGKLGTSLAHNARSLIGL